MAITKNLKNRFITGFKLTAAAMAISSSVSAVEGPMLPPEGQKLMIIGQDLTSIANYNSSVGISPAGVTTYTAIPGLGGLITNVDNGGGPNNAGQLHQDFPNSVHAIAVYLVNQLDAVNNGSHDEDMKEMARILASWERPIYLRWGYEFDGEWNHYDAAGYISAWKRMHGFLQEANADNVAMVWQSSSYCAGTYQGRPFTDWYPGDEYVDWIGLSYFTPQDCNWSAVNGLVDFARGKDKPVMVAESAAQRYDIGEGTYNDQVQRKNPDQQKSGQQIWDEWFATYFNWIEENSDVVKATAYINADWDSQSLWAAPYPQGYWGDTRVEADNLIKNNWSNEINQSKWLKGTPDLFDLLTNEGPVEPPVVDAVNVVNHPQYGEFLVAGDGAGDKANFTLYTFDRDQGGPISTCLSDCLVNWPLYTVEDASELVNNEGIELGTSVHPETEELVVTYKGEPLYFFTPDTKVGDTIGHGAGDVWWVADLAGPVIEPETCTGSDSPTATFKTKKETAAGANDGIIKFAFEGDGGDFRTKIKFTATDSDGQSFSVKAKDAKGKASLKNLAPNTYDLTSSWVDGSCPVELGSAKIKAGAGVPPVDPNTPVVTAQSGVNSITLNFEDNAEQTRIKFSIDGGATYLPKIKDNLGSYTIGELEAGTYTVFAAWGDGSNPVEVGTVTVTSDQGPVVIACEGADSPVATASVIDETAVDANDGSITFNFAGDNGGERTKIKFSVDGGQSFSAKVNDKSGSYTVENLAPGSYDLVSAWGDGSCPVTLQSVTIDAFEIPGVCDVEEPPVVDDPVADPAADFGDHLEVGITTSGIAYHREASGAQRGFNIWHVVGGNSNPTLVTHTTQDGQSYARYEFQIENFDSNATYQLEMRLQGAEFNTGQCIQEFSFKAGEGSESNCYIASNDNNDNNGGGEQPPVVTPDAPKQTVAAVSTDAQNNLGRLVAGEYAGDKAGYALYYFLDDSADVSNCFGGCEANWPKVIVDSVDHLVGAGGLTGTFGTIPVEKETTDECGNTVLETKYHVTYNQRPLYFFIGDTSAQTTAGKDINKWDLADVELIEQIPLVKNPAPSLLAAVNGLEPKSFGYAIDIEGRELTWRPSAYNNNQNGLIIQFSPWGGPGQPVVPKDPQLELYCSNNQVEFHLASMPGTVAGPYKASIPAQCYGKFYYFLRYRIYGTVNNQPEDNWVYTALYHYDENKPNDRFDPRTRPTVTYTSANWQRVGHPHSRDRVEEAILFDAMPYNGTLISSLERYTTTFVDGEGEFHVQPNATGAPLRIEAFEWGAGNCQGPQYMINQYPLPANAFDYGQIVSWEATFGTSQNNFPGGTSASSQIYNTMQNTTVGMGFTTSTGDPRLNSSGRAGVRMVHSDGCNPVEQEERNARFAQQVTTVQDASEVNDFLLGHDKFHGLAQQSGARVGSTGFTGSKAIVDVNGVLRKSAGLASCGDCHFRDGRSSFVVQTAKGPRLAPPTYGTGLLEWIEGAEVGLTWDGSVATVREQAEAALLADHGLTVGDIGQTSFDQVVTYTETLHVPVRDYSSYADPEVAEGEVIFHEVGCADCHQPTQKTRSDAPIALRDIYIRPYTDMKLWNVGTGGSFRTSPLWGIGENEKLLERNGKAVLYMHDGSATTLSGAIDAHGNGSVPSITATQKAKIVKFLRTL